MSKLSGISLPVKSRLIIAIGSLGCALLFSVGLHAQDPLSRFRNFGGGGGGGGKGSDTLEHRKADTITLNFRYLDSSRLGKLDSSVWDFSKKVPQPPTWINLGNSGAPARDLLRAVARTLTEPEVIEFADRAIQRQLRDLPIDATAGRWLDAARHGLGHPDFADAANNEWLGFHYRAPAADGALVPGDIAVCGFTLYPKGQAPDPTTLVPDVEVKLDTKPRRNGLLSWLRKDRVS